MFKRLGSSYSTRTCRAKDKAPVRNFVFASHDINTATKLVINVTYERLRAAIVLSKPAAATASVISSLCARKTRPGFAATPRASWPNLRHPQKRKRTSQNMESLAGCGRLGLLLRRCCLLRCGFLGCGLLGFGSSLCWGFRDAP